MAELMEMVQNDADSSRLASPRAIQRPAKRKKKSKIGELCQLSKKNQYGKVEF
jgi:hypothetical protein